MKEVSATVQLRTSAEDLWTAITDPLELPRHVPMLREVKILEAKAGGLGTVRECTLANGRSFHEEITVWEEGHRYCYKPNTNEAPFPFSWAEACWSIETSAGGSQLTYRLQYEPRSRLRDLVTYPLLRTYGVWQIEKMLRSYDQRR
jgi:ribosome-associated toxin RatA of RatAB toxin-antitoxin module